MPTIHSKYFSMVLRREVRIKVLLMALAAAAALPLVLLATYLVYGFGKSGYDNATRELVQRTESTAHAVNQELNVALAGLTALANSDSALGNDIPKLYEISQRLVKLHPAMSALSLVGPDQKMVFLTLRPLGTTDIPVSELDVVQQIFATGKPAVSGPFKSPINDRIVTTLSVPIVQNGKVAYCLRAIFPVDVFNRLLATQELPKDWTVGIVDKKGLLLARSLNPELFVGKPGSASLLAALKANRQGIFDGQTKEGVPTKTTIVKVSTWDWSVAIGVPTESLKAPMERALVLLIAAAVAVVLLGLVLSLWLARFITNHVEQLVDVSEAIHRGEKVDLSTIAIKELSEVAERMGAVSTRERRTNIALLDVTARSERTRAQLDMARRDALTGLPGRELFFETVEGQRKSLAKRGGGTLALLFIDLDGFKAVNDNYGHLQGDRVLVQTAEILNGLIRDTDAAGRLGGDEFVICLSSDGAHIESAARDVAERVLAQVKEIGFGISCSIGIAMTSHQCVDFSCAVRRADEAMYEAKRRGKNLLVVFGKSPKSDGSVWESMAPENCQEQCKE